MATSSATVPATHALLGWVHCVLNELRPFVEAPVFDRWLHHDKEGNAEDKVTVIANALQNLWDIRSPTHLITKDFGRRVDAFLDSVFFRRTGLAGDMGPDDSDFWRMVRHRSLLATPLANFMSAVNRGAIHRYGQPTNLSDEVDLERRNFRMHWKGELLRVLNSSSTTASSTAAHSLLKPEIGRRVAMMYGTSKARWERNARAF
ncbi:hypothetical protein NBRC10512_000720 [Rhodotorula toruloides]|uniref:RHTO0S27e00694g1_1 n=2 Tax=Rhodotorula toruloides TaxID=5286 RepID=A0A061BR11_RHOTO|nr:uncharacterized protein RHTO_07957 [Rhodotorula toruloides NP11]EMS22604.1 hypothetical protein RHTO_07957 [Rhodotorula toruloides NP11]CDR49485.1 RHTO0S27e00694g1_1 [Rhodotorula toruloides]